MQQRHDRCPARLEHRGERRADTIDERLHAERVDPATRGHRLHAAELDDLPDGAFVLDQSPKLVLGCELLTWSPGGYVAREPRPSGPTTLVTPPSLVVVLEAGWAPVVPLLHPSAR